jgi:hypothetical protein
MKNVRTDCISFVFLGNLLSFASSARAGGTSGPTWLTGSADFEIWLSESLTWDARTLITSATLPDDNAKIMSCIPGIIRPNTACRVQPLLQNTSNGDCVTFVIDPKSFYLGICEKDPALKVRVNPHAPGRRQDYIE